MGWIHNTNECLVILTLECSFDNRELYFLYVSQLCCEILHISFVFKKSLPSFLDGLLFVELLLLDSADKVSNCFCRFFTTQLHLGKELLF